MKPHGLTSGHIHTTESAIDGSENPVGIYQGRIDVYYSIDKQEKWYVTVLDKLYAIILKGLMIPFFTYIKLFAIIWNSEYQDNELKKAHQPPRLTRLNRIFKTLSPIPKMNDFTDFYVLAQRLV